MSRAQGVGLGFSGRLAEMSSASVYPRSVTVGEYWIAWRSDGVCKAQARTT